VKIEDGVEIECSCGFEGPAEPVEVETDIGKALVYCPKCHMIHIVEYEDKPLDKSHLTRTEAGPV